MRVWSGNRAFFPGKQRETSEDDRQWSEPACGFEKIILWRLWKVANMREGRLGEGALFVIPCRV